MSTANPVTLPLADYKARHVRLAVEGKVATVTLDRPERKNPLTFESYAELADLNAADIETLMKLLAKTKASARKTIDKEDAP